MQNNKNTATIVYYKEVPLVFWKPLLTSALLHKKCVTADETLSLRAGKVGRLTVRSLSWRSIESRSNGQVTCKVGLTKWSIAELVSVSGIRRYIESPQTVLRRSSKHASYAFKDSPMDRKRHSDTWVCGPMSL